MAIRQPQQRDFYNRFRGLGLSCRLDPGLLRCCEALAMSWKILEQANPELAEFGKTRLHRKVSYLATIRKDGSPRVHPMTPIIGDGRLLVFMEPTSPKGH